MSKAVLVLDMPKYCAQCDLAFWADNDGVWICAPGTGMVEVINHDWRTRPDWCPLQEVEPVRHGHWKALRGDWDGLYECQECGSRFGTPYYYCPACGVKMDCVDGGTT